MTRKKRLKWKMLNGVTLTFIENRKDDGAKKKHAQISPLRRRYYKFWVFKPIYSPCVVNVNTHICTRKYSTEIIINSGVPYVCTLIIKNLNCQMV